MLIRFLMLAFVCVLASGCGGESTPTVLDQNVERDPSLDDTYYDKEKQEAFLKGPENP